MRLDKAREYFCAIRPQIMDPEKYTVQNIAKDLYAGFIVAIISFPLAMALAIASGVSPEKGLITAVVAGAFTSIFGGCKFQIGGPTGAFVVIIFNIVAVHGFNGLLVASLMAGCFLMIAGFLRIGKIIQYMPYTVTAGFTAGIGVTLLSTQLHDLFGIVAEDNSGSFWGRIQFVWQHIDDMSGATFVLAFGLAGMIFLLQKFRPNYPRFLIAIAIGVGATFWFPEYFDTIGTRFADLKWNGLHFSLPEVNFELVKTLLPSALTIAFLSGIESLLCATIADGLTLTKHKSDAELIGQGMANIVAALFGGVPSTGALARTAANIKAGAVSPLSGIFQSLFVLSFMCFFMDYMKFIPIACLAGMLLTIAWNMIGFRQCTYIFRASKSDSLVFLVTFILTVVVDITVAVEIGVITAMLLFVHRLLEKTEINISEISNRFEGVDPSKYGVHCVNINGPLFFGVAPAVDNVLKRVGDERVLILNFEHVPLIDATGARLIRQVVQKSGIPVVLTNLTDYTYQYLDHIDYKHENLYGKLTHSMDEAVKFSNSFCAKCRGDKDPQASQ